MKQLHVRHQTSVVDPLRQERLRRALAIIMEYQEGGVLDVDMRFLKF